LNSFSQVNKSEWEAFLQDLSDLQKRFELLLTRLDDAERRLQRSNNPEQEKPVSKAEEPARPADFQTKMSGGKGSGFMSRLAAKLQLRGSSSIMRLSYEASCSRCGRKLIQPGRYCARCGADFGRILCSCGRDLSSEDKFCDRCGRPTAVAG